MSSSAHDSEICPAVKKASWWPRALRRTLPWQDLLSGFPTCGWRSADAAAFVPFRGRTWDCSKLLFCAPLCSSQRSGLRARGGRLFRHVFYGKTSRNAICPSAPEVMFPACPRICAAFIWTMNRAISSTALTPHSRTALVELAGHRCTVKLPRLGKEKMVWCTSIRRITTLS